jgi:YVTN family beta-propeller protein
VQGTWHKAIEVPGIAALNKGGSSRVNSISCASAGNCSADGYYSGSGADEQAFVVNETARPRVIARIPVGALPRGIAVNKFTPGSVSMINGRTNKVTVTVPAPTPGSSSTYGVAVSPQTGAVYVANAAGSVSVINPRTNKVTATVKVGGEPWGVAVSRQTGDVYVTTAASLVAVISGKDVP